MTEKDDSGPNLYDLLGVEANASSAAIRAAFLWKRRGGESDVGIEKIDAKALKLAYEVLSNAESRRHYDQTGEIPAQLVDQLPQTRLNFVIADLLGKAVAQMSTPQFDDLIKRMRSIAVQNLKTARLQAAKLEVIAAKLEIAADRIHTTGEENLVKLFVTTWQSDLPNMIAEIKRVCQLQEQALKYLETYSYSLDAFPDDNI